MSSSGYSQDCSFPPTPAWLGWNTFLAGAALGLGYGALTGATMILLRRGWHTLIPFGPALIAGAFTALLIPLG